MAKIEKNRVQLEIEVDAPEFDKALEQAYRKLVKKYTVPGFRKGKAPRRLLENFVGKAPFYDEAIELVVPEAYKNAVEEHRIEPIDQPNVELVQLEEGQPLVFKATVEVKPEVELGQYRELTLEARDINISEQDVDEYLRMLQQRHARMEVVPDGTVQQGDTVLFEAEGSVGDKIFAEKKEYTLEIGTGNALPGFEEQMLGARSDEERELRVALPSDYFQEDIAGKEAVFQIKVLSVKRKEVAPIDDEFARDVSEFETLEELRQDVANRLEKAAQDARKRSLESQAVEKAASNAAMEVPVLLVERRIDSLMQDLEQRLKSRGMSLESYLQETDTAIEAVRDKYRAQAEFDVKSDLVLESIAKKEELAVSQEDIDLEIERIAGSMKEQPETLKEKIAGWHGLESLKSGLLLEKTVGFLVANAVVTVPAEASAVEQSEVQEMAAENPADVRDN